MSLSDYFENAKGTGVLSTANNEGHVNAAIYARPHCTDEETVAFIMNDRLSHKNLTSNPKACFLFLEDGPGYKGIRLYLSMTEETTDREVIASLKRKCTEEDSGATKYAVYFHVDKTLPLIGT